MNALLRLNIILSSSSPLFKHPFGQTELFCNKSLTISILHFQLISHVSKLSNLNFYAVVNSRPPFYALISENAEDAVVSNDVVSKEHMNVYIRNPYQEHEEAVKLSPKK